MMNADPSLPVLTTEQIQKCLEENGELLMLILEGQKQGKHAELAPYQARLQHNLTILARMADFGPRARPQAQTHSQGQGIQQQHQVPMPLQRPDFAVNSAFDMNEQQQLQQQHLSMSLQQPDLSASNFSFLMNEQQHNKQPTFFQHQLFPEGVNSFTGTNNSGMQTGNNNLPDMQSFDQMGSNVGPGWS